MEWFTFIVYGLIGDMLFYFVGLIIVLIFIKLLIDPVMSR